MKREIKYDDPAATELVVVKTGVAPDTRHRSLGSYIDGRLAGGVLITDFNGHSCAIHQAGLHPLWLSKEMLWSTFYFIFDVLWCQTVFAYVASSNERALQITRKLGFEDCAVVPGVFADGDLIVLRMYKHTCKYLDIPFR